MNLDQNKTRFQNSECDVQLSNKLMVIIFYTSFILTMFKASISGEIHDSRSVLPGVRVSFQENNIFQINCDFSAVCHQFV